jgi:hypothetical protein
MTESGNMAKGCSRLVLVLSLSPFRLSLALINSTGQFEWTDFPDTALSSALHPLGQRADAGRLGWQSYEA